MKKDFSFLDTQRAVLHLTKKFVYNVGNISTNIDSKELLRYGIALIGDGGYLSSIMLSQAEFDMLLAEFGITSAVQQTFHKSWEKVATASDEQLIFEQIVHYFSTYGLESLGMEANPMIPAEDIVGKDAVLPFKAFTIVRAFYANALPEIVTNIFENVVAPKKDDIGHYIVLAGNYQGEPENIKSYELRCLYYDAKEIVPLNPEEFMRYVIYKLTGSTLVVKNKRTITALKNEAREDDRVVEWFNKIPLAQLASIFHRYKPLFLALRTNKKMRPIINKIRRLADTYHAPMSDLRVQNLAVLDRQGRVDDMKKVISRMTMRELIKVSNFAYNASANRGNLEAYNIRTGTIHIEEPRERGGMFYLRSLICMEMARRVANTMDGKIFYIPSYISYAAPISEKQFLGNIPYGSRIEVPKNVSVGIYWENYKGNRTDIDLHMTTPTMSYGWNSYYRDDDADALFSGDMTDATNGAAEAFYIHTDRMKNEPMFFSASNFTDEPGVPFKLIFTGSKFAPNKRGYNSQKTCPIDISQTMFPPIDMMFKDTSDQSIGLLFNRSFYVYGGTLSDRIVPNRDTYRKFIDAIGGKFKTMFTLSSILRAAGAEVVDEVGLAELDSSVVENVVDLSPNVIDRMTLIDLIDSFDKVN